MVKISVENSAYFFGEYMFSGMMGPVIEKALNEYQLPL
jgi:hypothetical protein